jgi:hypothetical protein
MHNGGGKRKAQQKKSEREIAMGKYVVIHG